MEVYKLEKSIEHDKTNLHMAMEQVKKLKEQLNNSLKIRREMDI